MENAELCAEKIRWVASSIRDGEKFRSRAKTAASDLGQGAAAVLQEFEDIEEFQQAVSALKAAKRR